ncbi:hypothetical protein Lal_00041519 [Lupinus albus]|nr:hypothetical protein Lal_00041519 [Lupinus albus]
MAFQINKETIFVDCFICYDNQQVIRPITSKCWIVSISTSFKSWSTICCFFKSSIKELKILIYDKKGKTINTIIIVVFKEV